VIETPFETADAGPVPRAFTAWTLNVYDFPVVKPLIVCDVAVVVNVRGAWSTPLRTGITT
jgi:hypothetical protein